MGAPETAGPVVNARLSLERSTSATVFLGQEERSIAAH